MDVGMPRLNGYEATRRIREQPWGEGMTIIALTGWGQDGDRASRGRPAATATWSSRSACPTSIRISRREARCPARCYRSVEWLARRETSERRMSAQNSTNSAGPLRRVKE